MGSVNLKKIQETVVQEQIHDALVRRRHCPECGQTRHGKGHHEVTVRTLFGNVEWKSLRLEHCPCQPQEEQAFSPLGTLLPEHVSPERTGPKWSIDGGAGWRIGAFPEPAGRLRGDRGPEHSGVPARRGGRSGEIAEAVRLGTDLRGKAPAAALQSEAKSIEQELQSLKWNLWHGNVERALERIATSFVESVVNQVVSKRMAKTQQTAWTERGAHLLLQV